MAVHVMNGGRLLEDAVANPEMGEESKVSSSSLRLRKLGTLVRSPENWLINSSGDDDDAPSPPADLPPHYVVGLTGGSGCGKSTICDHLAELGCYVVDCDKIGQSVYSVPHSPCWEDLVAHFGAEKILANDGSEDADMIVRSKLGSIVFADKGELERLNSLVWPHIATGRREQIRDYLMGQNFANAVEAPGGARRSSIPIIVVDAAVLLQAKIECDEVWVTFVPKEEQIRRICERDGKTEEQAAARVNSQWSHEETLKYANVVLTTMYERSMTKEIVKKAHGLLVERLSEALSRRNG